MLHLVVVASVQNSRITRSEFLEALPELDQEEDLVTNANSILGRDLREADLDLDEVVSLLSSRISEIFNWPILDCLHHGQFTGYMY